jgi:ankyrin repeat protein
MFQHGGLVANHSDVIAAVQSGDAAKLKQLLSGDPALAAAKDSNGISALMHALYRRQQEIADLLLAHNSDLNIFEATAAGKPESVSENLKKDPQAAKKYSADGFTALHFAAFFNQPAIACDLVRHGADVAAVAKNTMKVTPLHSAAAAHSREIVRLLLEQGAPADAKQQGGWTALHAAAENGDTEMVRDLLQHQADALARNDDGKTPADMAEAKGHQKVVELLSM